MNKPITYLDLTILVSFLFIGLTIYVIGRDVCHYIYYEGYFEALNDTNISDTVYAKSSDVFYQPSNK